MAEPLVGLKRISLAGQGEGNDENYALVVPASYDDLEATDDTDFASMSKREQIDWQLDFVRKHFVSGKIAAYNGSEFVTIDMTADHAVATRDLADYIYSEIMGLDVDPKVIREAVAANNLQTNDESVTETLSSEDLSESPTE